MHIDICGGKGRGGNVKKLGRQTNREDNTKIGLRYIYVVQPKSSRNLNAAA